jgi:hypothetical protein
VRDVGRAPLWAVAAVLSACAAPVADRADAGELIAIASDFRDFREWERVEIDATALPTGMTGGPAAVYAHRGAPTGAARFAVGTMFVKTIEAGPPSEWLIHAMVKRSSTFNASGTIGWEFFELRIEPDGAIAMLWRGEGPSAGHGYGRELPDGGSLVLVCNDCHAAAWQTDGVLTPALSPLAR